MRTIEFTEAAYHDIDNGYWFYEKHREGLGSYFELSIMADIRALHIHAGVHQIYFEKYYRKVARRFPWSIYYRIDEDVIRIFAVIDDRRDPSWISEHLN